MADSGSQATISIDSYELRVIAIALEEMAISSSRSCVTGGSLLRPAHGRSRCRPQIAGKERFDIGCRERKALCFPRPSGNGVPKQPAAKVKVELLRGFRLGST